MAETTEDQQSHEEMFADRFSADDKEYQQYVTRPADPPPIVEDWRSRGGGNRGRDRTVEAEVGEEVEVGGETGTETVVETGTGTVAETGTETETETAAETETETGTPGMEVVINRAPTKGITLIRDHNMTATDLYSKLSGVVSV
ncbi:RNMT-activating mini protein [Liparis tanakae]|uniref:RNMT-activating mini protein n=1 Tax=Liparis tanakae TaxID=230148 RepID=A0A4Z2G8N8_9TELE|nr:RNMT-activating mini protein [Liparis tanakae]